MNDEWQGLQTNDSKEFSRIRLQKRFYYKSFDDKILSISKFFLTEHNLDVFGGDGDNIKTISPYWTPSCQRLTGCFVVWKEG